MQCFVTHQPAAHIRHSSGGVEALDGARTYINSKWRSTADLMAQDAGELDKGVTKTLRMATASTDCCETGEKQQSIH
jgi:hypothetical protein